MRRLFRIVLPACLALCACQAPWEGPPDWSSIFQSHRVAEWKISTSSEDWLRLIVDPKSWPCREGDLGPDCGSDMDCPQTCRCDQGACVTHYVEAEVEVDGVPYQRVGLRLMGQKRRAKRNMRIRFNKFLPDQRFFGVKRINIRNNAGDPSLVREALALELMRRAGVPAPRYSFVWVSVNGDSGGVYTLVQQVDKKLLQGAFGEDFGNLYQIERGGSLVYQGDDPAGYYPPFEQLYELEANRLTADGSDLVRLMRVLAQTADSDLPQQLGEVLDVGAWLRWLAVNSWLANMDSHPGTADNLYLYHDASGRFRPLPWDLNLAFGNYHGPSCTHSADDLYRLDPFSPACGPGRPLVERALGHQVYRERYRQLLAELVDGPLHPDRVLAQMERLGDLVQDRAHQDTLKDYSNQDFDRSFTTDIPEGDNPVRVPGLQPFILARDQVVRQALAGP